MKVNEVIRDGLKSYKCRVRVDGVAISIGIRADSRESAFRSLSKCYGRSNIMGVTEVVISEQSIKQATSRQQVSAEPVASDDKHKLIQKILMRRLLRRSNIVRATRDDMEIAKNVVGLELKKADLEHEQEVKQQLRLQQRQARRRRSRRA
jgi:hypothetical protein